MLLNNQQPGVLRSHMFSSVSITLPAPYWQVITLTGHNLQRIITDHQISFNYASLAQTSGKASANCSLQQWPEMMSGVHNFGLQLLDAVGSMGCIVYKCCVDLDSSCTLLGQFAIPQRRRRRFGCNASFIICQWNFLHSIPCRHTLLSSFLFVCNINRVLQPVKAA